jgi:hypothetical protein
MQARGAEERHRRRGALTSGMEERNPRELAGAISVM